MLPINKILALLLLSTMFFILFFQITLPKTKPYNIILITVDAMRADHLGAYGYEKNISLNLDSLGKQGILFEQAVSQGSYTTPSIYSLMTGRYPNLIGFYGYIAEPLRDTEITLAQILQDNWFLTQAFTNFFTLNFGIGLYRGFDEYSLLDGYDDVQMNELVLDWIESNHDEKFFLYIHYTGPHAPLSPQQGFCGEVCMEDLTEEQFIEPFEIMYKMSNFTESDINRIICLYDCKINQTDFLIGSLVEKLKQLDLYDRTILVITADHGEHLFDRLFWYGHGASYYNDLIRVPLIAHIPGSDGGLRISDRVQLVDILPTILDFLNITYEGDFSGMSILPLIIGKNWTDRFILSGYLPDITPPKTLYVSDGEIVTSLGVGNFSDSDFMRYISHMENYLGYQKNLSLYPEQVDLYRIDNDYWLYNNTILRFLKCGDQYFYVIIQPLKERHFGEFMGYLNSANCDATNQTDGRYIIGNFSINYPAGQEVDYTNHILAVFFDSWKYIYSADGSEELYDLSEDFHEQNNLVLEYPEIAESMREYALFHMSWNITEQSNLTEQVSEELIQKLIELGYLII